MSQREKKVQAVARSVGAMAAERVIATNVRWWLLSILFSACMIAYFDWVNISVCGPAVMKYFDLTKVQYGMAWSMFTLAYTLFMIPGGLLSDRIGIRKTGALAMTAWSVFTFMTPLAWGYYSLLTVRFLFGAGEAPLFPNNGNFLQRWLNPAEKGVASGIMLAGAFVAPALAAPLSVWIMITWGWKMVFYIYAIVGLAIALIWYGFMREYPSDHPKCNQAERDIIGERSKAAVQSWGVWKGFLGHVQFWAHGLQYWVICYIWYVYLAWLPMYLLEARHLNLKEMGFAAAAPFVALAIGALVGGKLSDHLIKIGKSKFFSRVGCMVVGLLGGGLGLFLGSVAVSAFQAIMFLSIALFFAGFNFSNSWATSIDLGRSQAVAVVSWMNTWANLAGVVAPTAMAFMVQIMGWQGALNVTASMTIVAAAIALLIKPDHPLHA